MAYSEPVFEVYLALPMDGVPPDQIRTREQCFRDLLHSLPVSVRSTYEHQASEDSDGGDVAARAQRIVLQDLTQLEKADMVLVDYSAEKHAYIGCSCEIVYAFLMKKPIIAYVAGTGRGSRPWLLYHSTRICTTLDEVAAAAGCVLDELRKTGRDAGVD